MKYFLLLVIFPALLLSQLPPSYNSLPAASKLSTLWSVLSADQTSLEWYSPLDLAKIFLEDMKLTFDVDSDIIPEGRKKLIHSVGLVAQAELVVDPSNPYTGLFKSGVKNIIVRLSVAKKPDYTKTQPEQALDNFTPGMSLKFLRDGMTSANLLAMYGVNGFNSWNFFKEDFSNHIPSASGLALKALACKFAQATKYIQTIGLRKLAEYDETGKKAETPLFPFKLVFKARSDLKNQFSDSFDRTYIEQIKGIPTGTVLYDVYAVDQPNGEAKLIGSLRTKSDFITSRVGDEKLFFRHNYMDEDLQSHPEWEKDTPKWSLFSF
jgi:hypothetical protein